MLHTLPVALPSTKFTDQTVSPPVTSVPSLPVATPASPDLPFPDQAQPEHTEDTDLTPVAQTIKRIPRALGCLLPYNKAGKQELASEGWLPGGPRHRLRSKASGMNTSAG